METESIDNLQDTETVWAWQNGEGVTVRWGTREIQISDFKTLFAQIQDRGGIVLSTIDVIDATTVWKVIVHKSCKDIISSAFRISASIAFKEKEICVSEGVSDGVIIRSERK